ncbi:MAG: prolyl oligopeptidase family serine peptidase [Gammaproteobacteria bacterium]|nr:prolyl oligopeptidase family serine peptidase [Gammaproteobacteria bacterium]
MSAATLCACAAAPAQALAEAPNGYRQPPEDVVALLSAPRPPLISISPDGRRAMLVEPQVFAPLEELARPEVSLYGRRFDPRSHARRGVMHFSGLELLDLASGERRRPALRDDAGIGYPEWSPGGDALAFPVFTAGGVELWHARADDAAAVRLGGVRLNPAEGRSFVWMPDGERILCRLVPVDASEMPGLPPAAPGPVVMEAAGEWPLANGDALAHGDAYQAALFDYFMRSQLALADTRSGTVDPIGEPGLYAELAPSPDGRYILVSRMAAPARGAGPRAISSETFEVWSADGRLVRSFSPPGRAASPARGARRGFAWQHTAEAALLWIERAGRAGERIMVAPAPFAAPPRAVFESEHHVTGIEWLERSSLAVVHEYDAAERRAVAWLVDFAIAGGTPEPMWSRHIDDRYGDPGRPITRRNAAGLEVVVRDGRHIYLSARGATPHGERPFVSRWSLDARQGEVIWRSGEGRYETAIAMPGGEPSRLLIRHESAQAPPNYALERVDGGGRTELTRFGEPAGGSFKVTRQVLTFARDDGITLQATLYLPEDRVENERLPLVLWAYPRAYRDADNAGKISRSGDRYAAFDRAIPAFLAMRGFAVMDQVSMPIVRTGGEGDASFAAQIVASARAAIDKAVSMGVADPDRVGVAGHSYGAFMTVTLLAHSHLFKAGVALSGAYNRTLTPFGFQTERRTLWEAPGMYLEMSPFMYAHRIEAPLLLIHGGQDENAGTSPMQSERLFQAIRGQGGTVKLVMLPYEGHVYRARESVLHSAAEMLDWFARHLRRPATTADSTQAASSG